MKIETSPIEIKNKLLLVKHMIENPSIAKIFDFDHTIAESSTMHRQAIEDVCGIRIAPDYGVTHLRGKDTRSTMEIVLRDLVGIKDPRLLLDQKIKEREKRLLTVVRQVQNPQQYLMPGVTQIVDILRKTGQRAGIASQSSQQFIGEFLQRAGIGDCFPSSAIVGLELLERGERRFSRRFVKPSSDSIVHAAKRLGVSSQEIIYIGDNEIDAASIAGRSGITGLIVNADNAKRSKLEKKFGKYENIIIIGSLEEVINE